MTITPTSDPPVCEHQQRTTLVRSPGAPRGALRRAGLPAVGSALITLALAACGGGSSSPGVAGAGPSTTSTPAASQGGNDLPSISARIAFAQCMRSHGEPNWPDPGSGGGLGSGKATATTINQNTPQFTAANAACKQLLPNGGTPTQAQNEQRTQQALKFAGCMRSHGISDFPDSMQITGQGDLNPNNPRFQAATKACQPLQPGRGGTTP
jgi:hypothetical protein